MVGSFVLDVPPQPEQVRTARLFAAAVARHYGADEDRVEELKVAISEAATNSIKAHRQANVADAVRIAVDAEEEGLRFHVIDTGPGFVAPPVSDASAPHTPAAGIFEGSLGLALIRSLFPDVQIRPNVERGMTVSFLLETPPA
jgi:serine/threonine-protein kinase RsbW